MSSPPRVGARSALTLTLVLAASCAKKAEHDRADEAAPKPAEAPSWYDETRPLYNEIPVIVRFYPGDAKSAAAAWSYLESIDDVFNSYRADSEVGRLNVMADKSERIAISAELAEALVFSREVYDRTNGAFDVTVAPLIALWGAAVKADRLPREAEIEETLKDVGFDAVTLEGNSLTVGAKGAGTRRAFDFGGVIKGFAADRAAAILEKGGATSVFVQVGNETVAWGASPRGEGTLLAIEDPRGGAAPYALIRDPGRGLSATTSSNSKQPKVIGGVTYYHIVDPRTGRPVSTQTLSVTVVFTRPKLAGLADGLATAIAVLGAERGIEVAAAAGAEAMVLSSRQGELVRSETPGFGALVVD